MVDGYDRKGYFVGSMADAQAELISMRGRFIQSSQSQEFAQPSSRATVRKSCACNPLLSRRASRRSYV